MRSRSLVVSVLAVSLFVAACSNDSDSSTATVGDSPTSAVDTTTASTAASTTTAAPTTTIADPATAAMAYTEPGPYPVGVTTLQLPDGGPLVEVWYPAVEGTTGTERYDVRDFTPEALKALLTADVPADFSYAAGRDADMADGTFPLVANSHGFTAFRLASSGLMSHLASWGMVVVSPDHPSRDLPHLTDVLSANRPADTSVAELTGAIDLILAENTAPGSRFFGAIDESHIATIGHSAGGGTAYRVALSDDRVDGYVSMSSGVFLGGGNDDSSASTLEPTTTVAATYPDKPSFFITGGADGIVSADEVTRPSWENAPSPSLLWIVEGAGHLAPSDLCVVGDGLGIIGVAEANGLGAFLDATPLIRRLGSDGCFPPAAPVTDTFPAFNHAVTSWLRSLFGIDAGPVGLDDSVGDQYPTPVEIQSH